MALPPFPTMGNWFAGNDTPYNKSNTLLGVGLGLLSGKTAQDQVGQAASNFANERQMGRTYNKTLEYLKQNNPDLAQAVEAGALGPGDAYKLAYQQKLEAQKPKNNFITAGKNLYDTSTGQWIAPPAGMAAGDDEWGLNPVWGKDANGKTVIGQASKSGKFKPLDTGSFEPTPVLQNLDTGTAIISQNSRTGAVVNNTPKNLAEAASQKEIGEAQGIAISAAPGDIQAAQNALDTVQSLRNDPNKGWGTGFSSVFNAIPGSPGKDFQKKVDQSTSGAFLTAIQQMRGLGSLSNAEGSTATAAVARMDTATSEEEFNAALNDYEKIVRQGAARAQARVQQSGGQVQAPPGMAPPGATSSGVKWSVEP